MRRETTPLIERRYTPDGSYLVGWIDLREYVGREVPEAERGPCSCGLAQYFTEAHNARRFPGRHLDPQCVIHGGKRA